MKDVDLGPFLRLGRYLLGPKMGGVSHNGFSQEHGSDTTRWANSLCQIKPAGNAKS